MTLRYLILLLLRCYSDYTRSLVILPNVVLRVVFSVVVVVYTRFPHNVR